MPLHIPVFVVTGFLDSGKTALLNRIMGNRASRDSKSSLSNLKPARRNCKAGTIAACWVLPKGFGK
jgi:molybdopterin-guanine dinucleotide biosynthesis protein